MKFTALPVHDLTDVTLDLEQLQGLKILDRRVAFGAVTLTWPGATTFAGNQTVTHGLGVTPAAVLLGSQFMSATPFAFTPFVNSALGATTFVLSGQTDANPAAATTGVAWWLAIG